MLLKYGNVDKEEIIVESNVIKHDFKQWVQAYYNKMEKLFIKSKLENAKQKRRFFFQLCSKFYFIFVMWDYVNMDVMYATTLIIEWVVFELGETSFKPLEEELEKGIMVDEMVEK
jgi:hypothetical protein